MEKDSEEDHYDELAIEAKESWKLRRRAEKELMKSKRQFLKLAQEYEKRSNELKNFGCKIDLSKLQLEWQKDKIR